MRRSVLALAVLAAALVPAAPASAASTTGNLLVLVGGPGPRAAAAEARIGDLLRLTGASRAGHTVPQIGLVTVRPPAGLATGLFVAMLRALPGVRSVSLERRYVPRQLPNDPALTTAVAASRVVQWAITRENFPAAWELSHGDGALVGSDRQRGRRHPS